MEEQNKGIGALPSRCSQAQGSGYICSSVFLELFFSLERWMLPLTKFIFIFNLKWELNKGS